MIDHLQIDVIELNESTERPDRGEHLNECLDVTRR